MFKKKRTFIDAYVHSFIYMPVVWNTSQHDLHEEAELGKPLLWYKAWQWYEDTKEKEVDLREKIDSGIGKIVNSSLN